MIKRLIFDIDGTLVTGINFDKAITESLLKYNIFSEENKQKFFDAMITYEDNYFYEYYGEKICKPNIKVFLEAIRNK